MPNTKGLGVWPHHNGMRVITQSMVSSFVGCPRETYYANVLGLRSRISSMPLTRGTWVHALLEERANGRDWLDKHNEMYEKALMDSFQEEADVLEQECYSIMLSYDWLYQDDVLEPIAAELSVERPIFNGKAIYRGRVDLVVRDQSGDVWLLDHKTHRTLPDWRYRELAFQNYSYLWACKKSPEYLALGIPQPKGFIYDYCKTGVINLPKLTQSGKLSKAFKATSSTYPVFREWLIEQGMLTEIMGEDLLAIEDDEERAHVEQLLVEMKNRDYTDTFRRDYMEFSPEQSNRQLKSFLTTARRMLNYDWSDPDKVERNLNQCSGFMCHYKDLTIADLMHGTSELEQKTRYTTTSNPLDYYPNQEKKKTNDST